MPNPWDGVTKEKRNKTIKPGVAREDVYAFAHGAIAEGYPQAAGAAAICFEFLQRPENVLAGYLRWSDYRTPQHPSALRIHHHKTGAVVWHPSKMQTEPPSTQTLRRFWRNSLALGSPCS